MFEGKDSNYFWNNKKFNVVFHKKGTGLLLCQSLNSDFSRFNVVLTTVRIREYLLVGLVVIATRVVATGVRLRVRRRGIATGLTATAVIARR